MKLPFSWAVQARSRTSWQLRLNHFSTLAESENRALFTDGANGGISLPVLSCLPAFRGLSVWHVAQLICLPLLCFTAA